MTVEVGIAIGLSVASIAASLLLRPKPEDIVGPRSETAILTTSGYGNDIPDHGGSVRVSAERVWLKQNRIDEVENTEKIGGKGLGGGAKQTSYSYFGTWADSFGEGEASRVRRIWFNAKLVYDLDGVVPQKAGLEFRVHLGSDSQLPDPIMQSFIDEAFGEGSTPAYRGQVTIVFIDVALQDYGNSLPNVEVELEYGAAGDTELTVTTSDIEDLGPDSNSENFLIDFEGGRAYLGDADLFNEADRFAVVDIETMALLGVFGQDFDFAGLDHQGNLFGTDEVKDRNKTVNPYSGTEITSVAHGGTAPERTLGRGVEAALVSPLITERLLIATGRHGFFRQQDGELINICYGDPDSPDYLKTFHVHRPYDLDDTIRFSTPLVAGEGRGRVWSTGRNATTNVFDIWEYQIAPPVSAIGALAPTGLEISRLARLTPDDFDGQGGTVSHGVHPTAFDPTDDSLVAIIHLDSPSRSYVFKWSPTLGLLWKTAIAGAEAHRNSAGQHRLAGNSFAWVRTAGGEQRVSMVELNRGTILVDDQPAPGASTNVDGAYYDDQTRTLYSVSFSTEEIFNKIRIGATARARVTRAEIIARQCRKAGLLESEFDVTGVTGSVGGWKNSRRAPAGDRIAPLLQAFQIDVFMNGAVLTFADRGGATVGTIKEEDFLVDEDGKALKPRKVQEEELPETVSVLYADLKNDHLRGNQAFKRIRLPKSGRTITTRNEVTLSLPAALDAAEARAIAVKQMAALWNERHLVEGTGPLKFLEYNAGDSLILEREDGSRRRVRVVSDPLGTDLSVPLSLVGEDVTQYAATITTDAGAGAPQSIPSAAQSKPFLLNSTLLRDVDATDRSFGRLFWGASALRDGVTYPGALLYGLFGDTDFEVLDRVVAALDWGVLALAPPAGDRPHLLELGSAMEVVMVRGGDRLATTTRLNMLNGANAVYVLKPDGSGEVIGWIQLTDLGGGRYRFTDLLRGRRGSEWAMAAVAPGDSVIVLNRVALDAISRELGEVDVTRSYKIVTSGALLELAAVLGFTYRAHDLKPWAPAQITATLVSGDIVLTWTRRTRHGGAWRDGSGTVPLNEDSERYDIEILDGPGGEVVASHSAAREGLTAPTYSYLAADIAADFGPVPATLHVRVYQVSAQVGRGFTQETALEVA